MKLYRYRTIENALRELDNGAFYFADAKELNDPIEGYAKIFWQGDKPAWEGLLKNFVCSLFYTLQRYLLMAENFNFDARKDFFVDLQRKSLLTNLRQFDNSPKSRIFRELGEEFLSEDIVRKVTDFYGGNVKVHGREMEFILRAVVDAAFRICVRRCKTMNLIAADFDEDFFDLAYEISFEDLRNVSDADRKVRIEALENLNCDMMESGLLNLSLNQRRSTDADYKLKQHTLWLRFIFPRTYLGCLKEIMYPNGYVVCFSDTPTNSAMWGNYADDHRGICFVYETENLDGREVIRFAEKPLEVKPIDYSADFLTRNFFDTLTNLNFLHAEDWLTGRDGVKSEKLTAPKDLDYYSDYREKFFHKTNDWLHEREYRIFLSDKAYRYSDRLARTLRYDSRTLTGIIFGIRTAFDDKLRLIESLARLGKDVSAFDFFQAEYDDETQIISVREKDLLVKLK